VTFRPIRIKVANPAKYAATTVGQVQYVEERGQKGSTAQWWFGAPGITEVTLPAAHHDLFCSSEIGRLDSGISDARITYDDYLRFATVTFARPHTVVVCLTRSRAIEWRSFSERSHPFNKRRSSGPRSAMMLEALRPFVELHAGRRNDARPSSS
jgi:hypothetical protein